MAYTKAPTTDNHNTIRIPPFGGNLTPSSNTFTSSTPQACGYINCFPLHEDQWGTDPLAGVHKRDGWAINAGSGTTIGGAAGRNGGSLVQSTGAVYNYAYYAYSAGIYKVDYATGVNTLVDSAGANNYLGTLTNAINSANARKIACLEGLGITAYLTLFNEDGTGVTNTNLVALSLTGSKGLVFINGYLFAVDSTGNKIYNSATGGNLTTWNATDYLDAEQYADPILFITKHHNYLVALGTSSIEFFYDNAIEIGSPLARQENYSSRIGLYPLASNNFVSRNCVVASMEDDIYFLGISEYNRIGLYRIKNFQVSQVGEKDQFMNNLMNTTSVTTVFTWWVNTNPCIVVEFSDGKKYAYVIEENVWIQLTGSDVPGTDVSILGVPFVMNNTGPSSAPNSGCFLTGTTGGYPARYIPANSVTVTSTVWLPPIDHGINYTKHIARVDAIGDFGTNSVALSFSNSPNMGGTFVVAGTQTPSTIGYQNNISWYNLGAFRTYQLKFSMSGTQHGIFRGADIEYNIGVA